jgi:nucleoid DNA-binding protein
LIEAVSAKTDRVKSEVESILEAVLETIAERLQVKPAEELVTGQGIIIAPRGGRPLRPGWR